MDQTSFARSRAFFNSLPEAQRGHMLELIIREIYRQHLSPGDVAIDCGANHGFHTIPMAQCLTPGGLVLAIEAIEYLAQGPLVDVVRKAGLETSVRIVQVALGEAKGSAQFYEFMKCRGYSGLVARDDLPAEILASRVERTVNVETLDEIVKLWVAPTRPVRFIKMDLEGGEFGALKGATHILDRDAPLVAIEFGPRAPSRFGYSPDEFFGFFERHDYSVYTVLGEPLNSQTFGRGFFVWNSVAVKNGTIAIDEMLTKAAIAAGITALT